MWWSGGRSQAPHDADPRGGCKCQASNTPTAPALESRGLPRPASLPEPQPGVSPQPGMSPQPCPRSRTVAGFCSRRLDSPPALPPSPGHPPCFAVPAASPGTHPGASPRPKSASTPRCAKTLGRAREPPLNHPLAAAPSADPAPETPEFTSPPKHCNAAATARAEGPPPPSARRRPPPLAPTSPPQGPTSPADPPETSA